MQPFEELIVCNCEWRQRMELLSSLYILGIFRLYKEHKKDWFKKFIKKKGRFLLNNKYVDIKSSHNFYDLEIQVDYYMENGSSNPFLENTDFIKPLMLFLLKKVKFANVYFHSRYTHFEKELINMASVVQTHMDTRLNLKTLEILIDEKFNNFLIYNSLTKDYVFKIPFLDLYIDKTKKSTVCSFISNSTNIHIYNLTSEEKDYVLSLFQGKDFHIDIYLKYNQDSY